MAAIPAECVFEVILPLMTMRQASLLCISTPATDPHNHFTELMSSKLVRTLPISLLCETCRDSNQVACPHRIDDIPSWSSVEDREWAKNAYGSGRREQYMRETVGLNPEMGCVLHSRRLTPRQSRVLSRTARARALWAAAGAAGPALGGAHLHLHRPLRRLGGAREARERLLGRFHRGSTLVVRCTGGD
jgi:hypothetical protein